MYKVLAIALVFGSLAEAQDCPRPEGTQARGIATQSDQQRLDYIAELVSQQAGSIGTWKLVWGATFSVLTLGQLAAVPLFPQEDQPDYYWGAAYSALGTMSTLLPPAKVYERGQSFAAQARSVAPENRCALIAEGEALLKEGAENQDFNTRWFIHAVNIAVNLSLGAIIGFGYHHWTSAVINTIAGTALSEAMIFTTPRRLVGGWHQYVRGAEGPSVRLQLTPVTGGGMTAGVGVVF